MVFPSQIIGMNILLVLAALVLVLLGKNVQCQRVYGFGVDTGTKTNQESFLAFLTYLNFHSFPSSGFFPVPETDEDVLAAVEYGMQEVFGIVPGITYRIVNSQKKNDEGTHFEITTACRTESKSICKVIMFKVLDRYGEMYLESYDTLLDGTC